jgi:HK97 family phage portal protein
LCATLINVGMASWFAERTGIAPSPLVNPLGVPLDETADRSWSISDPTIAALLGYTDGGLGPVGETAALNLSAVFRAVSLVAGAVGSLPLRTLQGSEGGRAVRVASFLDNPGGDRFTPVEWAEVIMGHLLLHGNAYLQHIRNGAGQMVALYPVHPAGISTEWDDTRPGGKVHKASGVNSRGEPFTESFDTRTMTQVMGPSLDGLVGISCLHAGRLSLGTALAGERSANRQFRNGAMIAGLVTPADQEQDLDEDEAKAVKAAVNKTMTGPEHAGDIAVMSKALKFQPWAQASRDAQFLESRVFSVDEVGRWFGVPPHLLGLTEKSSSWGQGIAEQNRGLARYTLSGWTGRIEQRVSRLVPVGRYAEFDYSAFVRPAPEDEARLLIEQVNAGLLTLNEARAVMNRAPLPGGDLPRVPAGAAPPGGGQDSEDDR